MFSSIRVVLIMVFTAMSTPTKTTLNFNYLSSPHPVSTQCPLSLFLEGYQRSLQTLLMSFRWTVLTIALFLFPLDPIQFLSPLSSSGHSNLSQSPHFQVCFSWSTLPFIHPESEEEYRGSSAKITPSASISVSYFSLFLSQGTSSEMPSYCAEYYSQSRAIGFFLRPNVSACRRSPQLSLLVQYSLTGERGRGGRSGLMDPPHQSIWLLFPARDSALISCD